MKNLEITRTEKIAFILLVLTYALGMYFAYTDEAYFVSSFVKEDGLIESMTSLLLLGSSLLMFSRFFKQFKLQKNLWRFGVFMIALVFFFGAGEEISWGQRMLGIESSEFFSENNAQGETNLHNMVVNGKKINKLIFSQLLTVVLVIYLIILPFMYRKLEWTKKLVDAFGVPVVKWQHTIAFLICTLLTLLIGSDKKWELYEFAFSVIFLLIFLNPFNQWIYKLRKVI